MTYADRVRQLEAEGLCTSDAQGAADAEQMQGRAFDFDREHPLDGGHTVATCTPEVADFIDPTGSLRAAGLVRVVSV